jgi:Protein of unknown function (DUF2914)
MRVQKLLLFVVFLVLLTIISGVFTLAQAGGLKITEMAVTTKIVKGNPIDSVRRISSTSVKALYCFTRLTAAIDEDTTIKHVWYKDDKVIGQYELPVKGERWRTYSKKMVEKGAAGDWRVEALDSEGNILKTIKFRMN